MIDYSRTLTLNNTTWYLYINNSSTFYVKVEIDGTPQVAAETETTALGFKFTKDVSGKIVILMISTGVEASISEQGRSWHANVPTKYHGRTTGLCGLCDSNKDNDLWSGTDVSAEVNAYLGLMRTYGLMRILRSYGLI